MECANNPEREENINTVEELQNTKVNMGYIPKMNLSRKQNSCDQCEFIGSHTGLWHHKKAKHEGVRYPCDQCEYVATRVLDLKRHKESKHEEGIIYPCDKCDYVATVLANLKRHKKAKHEGVCYPCDRCEYVAYHASSLKRHKKSKHEGVKFTCDQCEYAATRYDYLKIHKKNKHSIVSSVSLELKNVRVINEKLDKRKYQISNDHQTSEIVFIETSNISDVETEIKQEDNIDDPLSLIKTEPIDNVIPEYDPGIADVSVKQEADIFDLESKIEIEEDHVLKAESLD